MESFKIKLVGGLGNQLHGMAAGYAIAGHTGLRPIFDGTDIPWGSNAQRKIEVDKFIWPNIKDSNAPIFFKKSKFSPMFNGPHQRQLARLRDNFKIKENLFRDDDFSSAIQIYNAAQSGKTLAGYFNDYEWIQQAFSYGFPESLEPTKKKLKVLKGDYNAIHIRLTDYLWYPDIYPLVTEKYLLAGIESFKSTLPFYIFTDDKKLSREKFPEVCKKTSEILGPKEFGTIESFISMSNARNIVTANSTFSAWAAIFIERRGGQVVTPSLMNFVNHKDFRPKDWIRISNEGK